MVKTSAHSVEAQQKYSYFSFFSYFLATLQIYLFQTNCDEALYSKMMLNRKRKPNTHKNESEATTYIKRAS